MPLEPPDPPLTDGVVTLRPPDERDTDAIQRAIRDPEVVRWLGPQPETAAEVIELNVARWRAGSPTFAVVESDDRCIGHVWVNVGDPGLGAVGYWLLPEARGRGLATRAVRILSGWAFGALALDRLDLFTERDNVASIRVAERNGFSRPELRAASGTVGVRRVDRIRFTRLPDDP